MLDLGDGALELFDVVSGGPCRRRVRGGPGAERQRDRGEQNGKKGGADQAAEAA
jgi:hypothetical protein